MEITYDLTTIVIMTVLAYKGLNLILFWQTRVEAVIRSRA